MRPRIRLLIAAGLTSMLASFFHSAPASAEPGSLALLHAAVQAMATTGAADVAQSAAVPRTGLGSLPAITGTCGGTATCTTVDLDASGSVTAADISIWLTGFFSGTNPASCDFDGNGTVGVNDLSIMVCLYWTC
jgi:hypothetical protein